MNIQIIGDNFKLSPSVHALINEKLSARLDKLLVRFAPEIKTASVRIQKDKLKKFLVNFDMNLPGKDHIYAETSHVKLESAIINLESQIARQIKKHKQMEVNYSLG